MAGIDFDKLQSQFVRLVQCLHQRELMKTIGLDAQTPAQLFGWCLGLGGCQQTSRQPDNQDLKESFHTRMSSLFRHIGQTESIVIGVTDPFVSHV